MVWWRRCAFLAVMVFGLSVGVPAQVVQDGGFPLGWLDDVFALRQAWAGPGTVTGLPLQQEGADTGLSGYVPASATTANGGAGRAPEKVAAGLEGYQPHEVKPGTTTTDGAQGFDAATSRRQASFSPAIL